MEQGFASPLRKPDMEMRRLHDRLAKLEARIMKLESAIEFIKTCHMHPNTKIQLDKILETP